ncbi:unnamed protein product, partial [Scytosiphon promiscuus]
RRLPPSTLVAAVKSLRTVAAGAMSTEKALSARAAATGGGGGGVRAGSSKHGGPSATRLVRYLTRQCDRLRGITTYSLVERNLDALMSELRSWPAGLGAAKAPAAYSTPPPELPPLFSSLEESFAAIGIRVSSVGIGPAASAGARVRRRTTPSVAGKRSGGARGDAMPPPFPSAPGAAAAAGLAAGNGGVGGSGRGGGGGGGGIDPPPQRTYTPEVGAVVPPPPPQAPTLPNITPPLPPYGAPGGHGGGGGGGVVTPYCPSGVLPPGPSINA